ncbi:TetR family transcriptional regulator C-terminal domain-containing protein [Blastococcus brunescens]|uniref:TetR family transcriptional regulator C-terminal domain-containing protein n=1 Tax=Blastococcus brunescens TaxID=1564165 RepID=A0ABZ1B809_9ACTN|nr:TetR family transcriptional regulator C-terminal domain-containing protein [Blastococcus sp. BMG 8361]WRL66884.1 TetR family transcriptional regulator C-terminal domain-containing protein [Blastococcus sp. BMG 8361]
MLLLSAEAVTDAPEIGEGIREAYKAVRERIQEYVEKGMADGSISSEAGPRGAALLLHGLLRGIVLQYFVSADEAELKDVRAAIHETLASLRPRFAE